MVERIIEAEAESAVPPKVLGRFRVAFRVIFFIAAVSILLGIVQILQTQGFGVVTISLGTIFLLLGFWVRRKSAVALSIAVTIYALDGILSLFTGNFLSVLAHICFLFLMSRGFSAIREILAAEAHIPGRKGFAGIGKKPDQYEAEVLQPAVVGVTYRTKVKISATIGEKKEETKTIYSQDQVLRSDALLEPANAKLRDDGGDGGIGGGGEGILCTNCGTVNPAQARFCTNCGRSLEPMEQMSVMQFREGSSFSPDDAPAGLKAEASTVPLLPSSESEEAAPLTGKQEAMSSIPPVSLPDRGKAIPMIENGLGGNNHANGKRRIRSWRFLTFPLIALILLGSSLAFLVPYLHTILPASSATVTITPTNKNFSNSYAISAVTGTPTASQVQARLLSTTMKKSQTVPATGQGTEGATEATGTLIFSHATGSYTIFAQTFADNSGVGLAIDNNFNIVPGQTVAIFAHAAQAGTIGNVPADDINATFNLIGVGIQNGTVHLENTSSFTGGTDRTYSFVQQSDIDSAVGSLEDQLTSDAQASVQNQVRANEQLVEPYNQPVNAVQCSSSKISSNHQANDRATDVTVTVSVTCQGEVFDLQATQAMAADLLKSDAAAQLGADYARVGNVVTGVPTILTTDLGGTVSMNVDARGVWVFQFGNSQKQNLAKLIAGKTQADASALLLKQRGIHKVIIATSGGWGAALPVAENIKMVVLSVPGL